MRLSVCDVHAQYYGESVLPWMKDLYKDSNVRKRDLCAGSPMFSGCATFVRHVPGPIRCTDSDRREGFDGKISIT